jgi:hypothetical protein
MNTTFFSLVVLPMLSGGHSESLDLSVHADVRGRLNACSGPPISTVHSDGISRPCDGSCLGNSEVFAVFSNREFRSAFYLFELTVDSII